jgi:hypothetical protein
MNKTKRKILKLIPLNDITPTNLKELLARHSNGPKLIEYLLPSKPT